MTAWGRFSDVVRAPVGLDDLLKPRGQIVTVDTRVIDVELGEDELVHGSAQVGARLLVASLRILEQVESKQEEVSAGVESTAGVLELAVDLSAFGLDGGELLLELGAGPVGLTE